MSFTTNVDLAQRSLDSIIGWVEDEAESFLHASYAIMMLRLNLAGLERMIPPYVHEGDYDE